MSGVRRGIVEQAAEDEFPGTGVLFCSLEVASPSTPAGLAFELSMAADRIRGASALTASIAPVAAAFRSFMRQLGMDPEAVDWTADAAMRRRLIEGGLPPTFWLRDAATLAVLEFGAPLMLFEHEAMPRDVELRSADSEGALHAAGDLVVAADGVPLSRLFGPPFPEFAVSRGTRRALVVSVRAPGVEDVFCRAALERCADLLELA